MINGIPVKIKVATPSGTDVETVYFATYRKCPALAARTKRIAKLEVDVKVAERMKAIAEEALKTASDQTAVSSAASAMDISITTSMDAQDAIVAEFEGFVKDGFKAAGYDDANVDRIAEAIPVSRMGELVGAARIGSGVLDFFAD